MIRLSRRAVMAGIAGAPLVMGARDAGPPGSFSALRDDIAALIGEAGIPGAGIAMVTGSRVVAFGVGAADLSARRMATAQTPFHIASISKVVTATALMTLVDRGRVTLDEPIQPHLDFPLVNPAFPGDPITLRQLLQHTSGISDGNYGLQFYVHGDPKTPLREFLTQYLVPGGRWYAPQRSFADTRPGARWAYSNVGIALAGYLAGRIGAPLERLSQRSIFAPARMHDTTWRLAETDRRVLAIGYARAAPGMPPVALPPLGYPDWPAGMVRSSARDLGRFLTIFTAGTGGVLSANAIGTMERADVFPGFTTTLSGQAIGWRRVSLADRAMLSHTGSDPGVTAGVYFDPNAGIGAVVLMNLTADDQAKAARDRIAVRLVQAASALRG